MSWSKTGYQVINLANIASKVLHLTVCNALLFTLKPD